MRARINLITLSFEFLVKLIIPCGLPKQFLTSILDHLKNYYYYYTSPYDDDIDDDDNDDDDNKDIWAQK